MAVEEPSEETRKDEKRAEKEKKEKKKKKKEKKARGFSEGSKHRRLSPSPEWAPRRAEGEHGRSRSLDSTSTVDSFGRENPKGRRSPRQDRSPPREWTLDRSSTRRGVDRQQRSVSPRSLARSAAPPADPKRIDHDDRSSRAASARSYGLQQPRDRRSRSPSPLWNHEGFIQALKEPSPERMVASDYVPPKPEWISRAGGVYIPNRPRGSSEQRH
jgi:hypothetical protein